MEHEIPFGNSNRENGTTFLDFPLFLGIFQWDEPTKRVPFTAEPEIQEILTKWKAPLVLAKIAWVSGVSGEKGKNGSEKGREKKNLLSPNPVGRPDTQAIAKTRRVLSKNRC